MVAQHNTARRSPDAIRPPPDTPMLTLPKALVPYPLSELKDGATITDLTLADVVKPWLRQLAAVARLLETAGLEDSFIDDRTDWYVSHVGLFLGHQLQAVQALVDLWYDGKHEK